MESKQNSPKITAHRGFAKKYPQNTMLAFKKAVDLGAERLEFDLHLSKDKQLIIHHDYNLKDPSGGIGLVEESTAEYIKSLDAGSWMDKEFKGEKIPFLKEVFETFNNKIEYEIELKGFTAEFVDSVIRLIREYGLTEFVEITSPHPYILTYVKENYKEFKTGMFISDLPEWMDINLGRTIIAENGLLGHINVLHFPLDLLSEEYIESLHKQGFTVHAANCDTQEELSKAFKLGVDQLSTYALVEALSLKGIIKE